MDVARVLRSAETGEAVDEQIHPKGPDGRCDKKRYNEKWYDNKRHGTKQERYHLQNKKKLQQVIELEGRRVCVGGGGVGDVTDTYSIFLVREGRASK